MVVVQSLRVSWWPGGVMAMALLTVPTNKPVALRRTGRARRPSTAWFRRAVRGGACCQIASIFNCEWLGTRPWRMGAQRMAQRWVLRPYKYPTRLLADDSGLLFFSPPHTTKKGSQSYHEDLVLPEASSSARTPCQSFVRRSLSLSLSFRPPLPLFPASFLSSLFSSLSSQVIKLGAHPPRISI